MSRTVRAKNKHKTIFEKGIWSEEFGGYVVQNRFCTFAYYRSNRIFISRGPYLSCAYVEVNDWIYHYADTKRRIYCGPKFDVYTERGYFKHFTNVFHGESSGPNSRSPGKSYRNKRQRQHRRITKQQIRKQIMNPDIDVVISDKPINCWWDWS